MRKYLPKKSTSVPPHARRVFKGIIYDVYHWEQELFDGTKKTFEMLKRPDTVRVIAIKDDKILITQQEQPHIGKFIDIPGGVHDIEGENELDAAKRELKEETGLIFKKWKLLNAIQVHPKIEQISYLFLATDPEDRSVDQCLDAGEKIDVKFLRLEEVKELFDKPEVRFLPKDILGRINDFSELEAFSELNQL